MLGSDWGVWDLDPGVRKVSGGINSDPHLRFGLLDSPGLEPGAFSGRALSRFISE